MRILFAGTPAIAVPALEALAGLHQEGGFCELAGVLTNPDTAKGRIGAPTPSEVGAAAARIAEQRRLSFAILKSESPDETCPCGVAGTGADLLVSFAYGAFFSPEFLSLFPMGGINIHPSLLPKYRGASPIQSAILNRDSETGISIQRLAADLDSGDLLAQETIALTGAETSAVLGALAAEKGAALLVRTLRRLAEGTAAETPQAHEEASYCDKLERADGRIDWRQSALDIDARIRAFTPWPLSYTRCAGMELYILEAAPYRGSLAVGGAACGAVLGADRNAGILIQTGDGVLAVSRLQYRTRKALDWRSFLNGARNFTGSLLDPPAGFTHRVHREKGA
ncbi:MAG: methionyl-tRNA formyltransferase [Spirochaetaceae bacterium]|jgi:methionyl-tRNA formyltransferase|nr:methionyl-tRNA formyltransferase [Spirochaetaceae bacterium]